jgi:hypothetical protein
LAYLRSAQVCQKIGNRGESRGAKETYSNYIHCSVYYSGNLRFCKASTGK